VPSPISGSRWGVVLERVLQLEEKTTRGDYRFIARKGNSFMDTFTLLITVFLLILVLGMQIQISDMTKKIDELVGTKPKPKKR